MDQTDLQMKEEGIEETILVISGQWQRWLIGRERGKLIPNQCTTRPKTGILKLTGTRPAAEMKIMETTTASCKAEEASR